jgi:trimeric autotransporter adhesin
MRSRRKRFAARGLLVSFFGVVWLSVLGCSGSVSSGGGTKPPPQTITLTSTGPYNATFEGNNWVPAGVPAFTILATGTGFTSACVIQWNGNALPTQYGSSTNLAASASSALVAAPGNASITVYDTASGAVSNALPFGIASPAAATAGVVQVITVAPDGTPANDDSLVAPSISTTGRFIAFQSAATNLAPGPASGYQEVYERDTCIGAPIGCTPSTVRVTVTDDGSPVNGHSYDSSISTDGRYVAFDSVATNIVPNSSSACNNPPGNECAFLRDTCTGAPTGCAPSTIPISLSSNGTIVGGGVAQISPDGRYVTFGSNAANVAGNAPGGQGEIYLTDTCHGVTSGCAPSTTLISQSNNSDPGNENAIGASVSSTGRYSAFGDWSSNLGQQNENGWPGVFLRDDCIGAPQGCTPSTTKIDNAPDGSVANGYSGEGGTPAVSADGRLVAFDSAAMNLVVPNLAPCNTGGTPPLSCGYIFVRDTCNGATGKCTPATSMASLGNDGSLPNAASGDQESMSADGRFVAFASLANNIVPGDTFSVNGWKDVFVRDTCYGAPTECIPSTVRVSVANYAKNFAAQSNAVNDYPRISGDGHYIVFLSAATNYLASGGNGHIMVYLAKTGF